MSSPETRVNMGPCSEEASSRAAPRGVGSLPAGTAGEGLSDGLLPARRRLCWAVGSWARRRRPCRREGERGCAGRHPGRRAARRRTAGGMKKRREGGESWRCWPATLSLLLKWTSDLSDKDKKKKKKNWLEMRGNRS